MTIIRRAEAERGPERVTVEMVGGRPLTAFSFVPKQPRAREVVYVRADLHRGAVGEAHAVAKALRRLGEEYRDEYPDGRVAKRELNEQADRLDAIGGQ